MFVTAASLPDASRHRHEVVVIGGGAAGITLAGELADRGVDVAVVEGGARAATTRSQDRYRGPLSLGDGLTYPALDQYRLRWFGGTTNHWGGWCRPLDPSAMAARPGITDGWPFGRDELDPWYEIAHRWCEIGRDEYRPRHLGPTGRALAESVGDRLDIDVLRFSPPTRFGVVHAARFESAASSPTAYLEANCVEIACNGDAVTAVVIRDESGGTHTVEGDTVVIACGAIESVRQLLLMQRRGVRALGRSGRLGIGFHEHPHLSVGTILAPAEWVGSTAARCVVGTGIDRDRTPYRATLAVPRSVRAEQGLSDVSFMFSTRPATGAGDSTTSATALERVATAAIGDLVPLAVYARAEQRDEPTSRITLSDENDDLGMPRAGLDWRMAQIDVESIIRSRDLVATRLFGAGFGPALEEPAGPGRLVTGGAHHMGGARLSDSPDRGVVDADLRCHGLANLYVCGSAVFPTSGWSNPTLTIVALAARLAHHLAERA